MPTLDHEVKVSYLKTDFSLQPRGLRPIAVSSGWNVAEKTRPARSSVQTYVKARTLQVKTENKYETGAPAKDAQSGTRDLQSGPKLPECSHFEPVTHRGAA